MFSQHIRIVTFFKRLTTQGKKMNKAAFTPLSGVLSDSLPCDFISRVSTKTEQNYLLQLDREATAIHIGLLKKISL